MRSPSATPALPTEPHPTNTIVKLFRILAAALLALPLTAQEPATASNAPLETVLTESLESLEREALPALRSARDEASAHAAAVQLEQAIPHIRLLMHILADELSVEEQKVVLPMLAPRMTQLLGQLDSCCSMAADLLCLKPAAHGSERLATTLATLLDTFMGAPAGTTTPQDIPLALAEADAQLAAASALLASLERLQSPDAVERELPTVQKQLEELRSLQIALSDTQRWSKSQLFLIMQRTHTRGAAIMVDLGKCTARLMGLTPPCYGSPELETLLNELIQQPNDIAE